MLKVKINNDKEFQVDVAKHVIDGKSFSWDLAEIKDGIFHIIRDHKSYNAEVIDTDFANKEIILRINGNRYSVKISDKYDELLHQLGMDKKTTSLSLNLKAPMPGLVIDIRVSEGNSIAKGDALVVLEAMKMENVLRAQENGTIKKILVKKGDKVEKGQLLVEIGN